MSSGYGRRIRFLVLDDHNNKLIGIIGLGDPVFGLGARDQWIGWDAAQRRNRLRHILDAYVLGAVPPYTELLGGKLVAMLAASMEVREAFERKYAAKTALISGVKGDARVAASSRPRLHWAALQSTTGSDFVTVCCSCLPALPPGQESSILRTGSIVKSRRLLRPSASPRRRTASGGRGFRSRREVIRKALAELGLPDTLIYHGVQRQVYLVPLARNAQAFLRGDEEELDYYCQDADSLFEYFKSRWLLPRAERTQAYREFDPASYLLWHRPDRKIQQRGVTMTSR